MPNVGDVIIVAVYEDGRRVPFSLKAGTCVGMIKIIPGNIAMQQKVIDIQWGFDCKADVKAADGNTSALEIFALPAG